MFQPLFHKLSGGSPKNKNVSQARNPSVVPHSTRFHPSCSCPPKIELPRTPGIRCRVERYADRWPLQARRDVFRVSESSPLVLWPEINSPTPAGQASGRRGPGDIWSTSLLCRDGPGGAWRDHPGPAGSRPRLDVRWLTPRIHAGAVLAQNTQCSLSGSSLWLCIIR